MINFSTQCNLLRDSYIGRKESNMDVKLQFLSKIIALSFFLKSDGLPIGTPLGIFCGDIKSDRQTLTASLVEVINDLHYDCCVTTDFLSSANMLTLTVA